MWLWNNLCAYSICTHLSCQAWKISSPVLQLFKWNSGPVTCLCNNNKGNFQCASTWYSPSSSTTGATYGAGIAYPSAATEFSGICLTPYLVFSVLASLFIKNKYIKIFQVNNSTCQI